MKPRIGASGAGGRVFLTLFFLVFFAMGCLFTGFVVKQVSRDASAYSWERTECVILESSVADKGGKTPYVFEVSYQYEWKGKTYGSRQYSTQTPSFSDYGGAQSLAERYRADTKAICYINPKAPHDAVLQRANLWLALFVFLPLIFVVVGAGGIYFVWKSARSEPFSKEMLTKPRALGPKAGVALYILFLLIGSVISYFIPIRPVMRILQAREWNARPCTVVSSRVQSHDSDDGTTYSVKILYAYEVNGREYKANRYNFVGGSSSGYSGKAAIVKQHPPGSQKVCYVNPADPTDAVLRPGFTPMLWFGLIPLSFVAFGFVGVVGAIRKARAPTTPPGGTRPHRTGTVTLKPRYSPRAKCLGGLIASIFWNGIVSVFVYQAVEMWRTGNGGFNKWFLTLFLIPFVLVGLGLIGFTIHSLFGLFSPRAELRVSSDAVALGDSIEVQWQIGGRVEKVRDLQLTLEGRRETEEGSGDDRRTKTDVFYKANIAHVTNWSDIKSGKANCAVPPDKMPSDNDGDHEIIWVIRLKAKVEFGADLNDEYPITVVSAAARLAA